jgi:hypothetical protein
MNNVQDITLKLERLAEKQSVWKKMTPQQKLPYLEAALQESAQAWSQGFCRNCG